VGNPGLRTKPPTMHTLSIWGVKNNQSINLTPPPFKHFYQLTIFVLSPFAGCGSGMSGGQK